jgi:surface polysaccharide O-acyltransferase-like enzyme
MKEENPVVQNPSDPWVDLVRSLAVALVILIHCSTTYVTFKPEAGATAGWVFACYLDTFSQAAVPLFFMISGHLLLRPGIQVGRFLQRRLNRIFLPLVTWSAIYILVRIELQENQISLLSSVRLFYNGEVYFHLWFLYALAGVYLAFPFLSPLTEPGRKIAFYWLTGCTIVYSAVIPTFDRIAEDLTGFPVQIGIRPALFWMHLGYALLGVICGQAQRTRARFRLAIAVAFLFPMIAGSIRIAGPLLFNDTSVDWIIYTQPILVAGIASLFYSSRFVRFNHHIHRFLQWFSSLSFCIYLSHPLVQEIFAWSGFTLSDSSFIGIPIYFSMTLLASLALSWGLLRLPKVGKFFG